jgi:osmotically-inducible protein OsmY
MKYVKNEITESHLRQTVMQHLQCLSETVLQDLGVIVSDGIVTLTGSVDTPAERLAAEYAVKGVAGVKGIADEIQVRQVSPLNDTEIARNTVHALESQPLVPRDQIMVTVSEGWVKLEGHVEWMYEKKVAESAVRNLLGVKGVFNDIEITPKKDPEYVSDTAMWCSFNSINPLQHQRMGGRWPSASSAISRSLSTTMSRSW